MKVDLVSSSHYTSFNEFSNHETGKLWEGIQESNNNMDDEETVDEDENINEARVVHQKLVRFESTYLIGNDEIFDYGAIRTGGVNNSSHQMLRSVSLNNALDDVGEMCEVCNYREKMGRNRRRPSISKRVQFQTHEMLIIFYLGLIDFVGFCSMSVMAPFFPREAEKKDMDVSHAGYVFSFYALIMFLTAPIFGKLIPCVGTKFMFLSGIFVTGTCNLLFGLLPYIQNNTQFAIFCFLVRGVEALGAGAFSTASFIYVIHMFPDNVSGVLGVMETFAGLGMSIGPAFGGFMYEFGGFSLPFFTLGSFMLLMVPLYFYVLPTLISSRGTRQTGSLLKLVKIPSLLIICLVIVVASNAWAFLDPTLEPHLRQLNLSSRETGFVFLIFSAFYAVFSPIWGFVGDKFNNHWSIMAIGLLGTAASLVYLGPAPIIHIESTLFINILALCFLSIFVSMTLAPSFKALLESAFAKGYPDNISTYSVIAGVWSSGYSLGDMTGPTLGGILLEYFDYPTCTSVMAILALTMASICLFYFGIMGHDKQKVPRSPLHTLLMRDKIAYYGALSNSSDAVNITVTNSGACEV